MLYVVPTPIGNLEDLSPRSLRVLGEVSEIYCEDTRRTRKLLAHFGLRTPLKRYQDRDRAGIERILGGLAAGKSMALVSDAGTPVVSDPGAQIIARARAEGFEVVSLPGPSAVTAALAGSGLPADTFIFLGFLPRSRGKQRKALEAALNLEKTIVVYESPYRVAALLAVAEEVLGPQAQAVVAREISKIHEEWLRGTIASVRENLAKRDKVLGEFVVMLHPGVQGK